MENKQLFVFLKLLGLPSYKLVQIQTKSHTNWPASLNLCEVKVSFCEWTPVVLKRAFPFHKSGIFFLLLSNIKYEH